MPIEGSRTHVMNNLGLDLNAYIVQGKSFARSVSVSEPSAAIHYPSSGTISSQSSAIPDCLPSSVQSGTSTRSSGNESAYSYSPFSSTAATISPDSPNPPTSIDTVRTSTSEITVPGTDCQLFQTLSPLVVEETLSSPSSPPLNPNYSRQLGHFTSPIMIDPSAAVGLDEPLMLPNHRRVLDLNPFFHSYNHLFKQYSSHRTINLLAHLLNSRLSMDWRLPLDRWQKQAHLDKNSQHGSKMIPTGYRTLSSEQEEEDTDDGDDDGRYLAIKRCKSTNSDIIQNDGAKERTETTKSDFISPRLIASVQNLTGHFESRYRDKLGDLLDDVARLDGSSLQHPIPNDGDGNDESEIIVNDVFDGPNATQSLHSSSPLPLLMTTTQYSSKTMDDGDGDNDDIDSEGSRVINEEEEEEQQRDGGEEDIDALYHQLWELLDKSRNQFHSVLEELFAERINWGRIVAMLAFVRALCEVVEQKQHVLIDELRPVPNFASSRTVGDQKMAPCTVMNDSLDDQSSPSPSSCQTLESSITTTTTTTTSNNNTPMPLRNISKSSPVYEQMTRMMLMMRPCASDYIMWTTEFIHGTRGVSSWIEVNGNWEGLIDFENHRHTDSSHSGLQTVGVGGPDTPNTPTSEETMCLFRQTMTSVATIAIGAVGLMVAYRYLSSRL